VFPFCSFLAFANSAPDFFASFVAITGGDEDLGMGDLLGNGVFTPVVATGIVSWLCAGAVSFIRYFVYSHASVQHTLQLTHSRSTTAF
jgi:Ca2+/Na+ antiporter